LTETINSVDDGIQRLWPFVSEVFRQSWDAPKPPDATVIRSALRLG
jgi:hypothetical protein